jgi:hypothetical protein
VEARAITTRNIRATYNYRLSTIAFSTSVVHTTNTPMTKLTPHGYAKHLTTEPPANEDPRINPHHTHHQSLCPNWRYHACRCEDTTGLRWE